MISFDKLPEGEYCVKINYEWTYAHYNPKYNDWYSSEDDWYYDWEDIQDIDLYLKI